MYHGALCSIEVLRTSTLDKDLSFGYLYLRALDIATASSSIILSFTLYYCSAHPIPTSIHIWLL